MSMTLLSFMNMNMILLFSNDNANDMAWQVAIEPNFKDYDLWDKGVK